MNLFGSVYFLGLLSNLFFSTASLVFAIYATRFSPGWINRFKVLIGLLAFTAAHQIFGASWSMLPQSFIFLILSGLIGLCLGDQLLFRAYTTLGPGRSLVLFSFQPLILGAYGWFLLGQSLTIWQGGAVFCMISCLFVFVLERNKMIGHWDFKSFLLALGGISLDAIGVMLTRQSFDLSPSLDPMTVNVVRCLGAFLGFFFFSPRAYFHVFKDFSQMLYKEKLLVFSAAFFGTFISLALYLTALKSAHVASLSAIAITGPVWVSFLECVRDRKWPNGYQLTAMIFFIVGFLFLHH